MPPLTQDPHVLRRVEASTLDAYRKAGREFMGWLDANGLKPETCEEWDDLLVEWKNASEIPKTKFSQAVCCVEFFFVSFRGELSWSRAVLRGMDIAHEPQHTVPLTTGPAALISWHMAAAGLARLAVGMLLQVNRGLRPSEMLNLLAGDCIFPEQSVSFAQSGIIVNLGVRKGTKAKRPQAVIVPDNTVMAELLRRAAQNKAESDRMFPYSISLYNRVLKEIEKTLNLSTNSTPHSPRAGFATELRACGAPFSEIREQGRWLSDSSLRVYLDVVGAAQLEVNHQMESLRAAIAHSIKHLLSFLTTEALNHAPSPSRRASKSPAGARRPQAASGGDPTC